MALSTPVDDTPLSALSRSANHRPPHLWLRECGVNGERKNNEMLLELNFKNNRLVALEGEIFLNGQD
jgi:hypothetical protein